MKKCLEVHIRAFVALVLLACCVEPCHNSYAFVVLPFAVVPKARSAAPACCRFTSRTGLSSSPSSSSEGQEDKGGRPSNRPKNLVDQKTFIAAVDVVKKAMADSEEVVEDDDVTYVIGRTVVSLNIESHPGIDLAEAGDLVLVIGVTDKARKEGVMPLDTIVEVSVEGIGFRETTRAMNLDATAGVLMAAAQQAAQKGIAEIELELNRLIKGYYAK